MDLWRDNRNSSVFILIGRSGDGIAEPIKISQNLGYLGVGKLEEDNQYTENVKRKQLESERELDEAQIKKKEEHNEKAKIIKDEIKEINKVFFCELCKKQYTRATEYETHLDSYEHNHKKRLTELKQLDKQRSANTTSKSNKIDKELERAMQLANQAKAKSVITPTQEGSVLPTTVEPSNTINDNQNKESSVVPPVKFSLSFGNKKPKIS